MFFSIQKELFDILPDLTIGIVVARDVDNTRPSKETDDLLVQAVEEMKGVSSVIKLKSIHGSNPGELPFLNWVFQEANFQAPLNPWRGGF